MNTKDQDPAAFFPWLAGQPRASVAGRLSLRLFADLAAGRLAQVPTTLHEVKEWARTTRRGDAEVQQWLPVTIKYWKQWLATTTVSALVGDEAK
ncbi:hypothetical protein NG701_20235 [Pseudarthrobacter sp. HLT3-5]|uniref:hypothetical protein n=1 Tax=Pseudarthrobacter cellobiosi TaxID=2953654 RepID=UPI00208E3CAF|nr:hypothetical protein [Pseudarthrobacter sp. HLT3-5]MCO4276715.1 hypothetical protein [Pseudarthrobacter sp. HLT3-5]